MPTPARMPAPIPLSSIFSPHELRAISELIDLVRRDVAADLVQASLFGSRARGEDRPDSDLDILLVFRWLPVDREPYASRAESIAEAVAARTGVPVTVWSVSLPDLERGWRTPMLVDALEDSIPLWCRGDPLPVLPFTAEDAVRCVGALLTRVEEGSAEVAERLESDDPEAAFRRGRDDLVRLCTACLLLEGITRPRRGEAVRESLHLCWPDLPGSARSVLLWASDSFGPTGRDEDAPVGPAPGGLRAISRTVELLRERVAAKADRVAADYAV